MEITDVVQGECSGRCEDGFASNETRDDDVDLERTALIVVDMQNAFASEGGMFDLAGFDISGAGPVIEVNRRLLDASRKARDQSGFSADDIQAGFERCGR